MTGMIREYSRPTWEHGIAVQNPTLVIVQAEKIYLFSTQDLETALFAICSPHRVGGKCYTCPAAGS